MESLVSAYESTGWFVGDKRRAVDAKVNEWCCVDPRVWASIVNATPHHAATDVPLDEVVRQDRPGVKITYRGNLSETGSISRRGDREEDEAIWNKNARRVGGRGIRCGKREKERRREKADQGGRMG